MKYYFYKLIPPRPTFLIDMTEGEVKIMQEHVVYWRELMEKGCVIAFGPVADPGGPYGIGIIRLQDDENASSLADHDPAMLAKAGFRYEIHPMPQVVSAG